MPDEAADARPPRRILDITMGSLLPGVTAVELGLAAAVLILLILVIVLLVQNAARRREIDNLYYRLEAFMTDSEGDSLESSLTNLFRQNRQLAQGVDRLEAEVDNIYDRLQFTVQKTGLVKYDAFPQMGGSLSFALVLLDRNNDGIIINSVHSTDGCYSYAKRITDGRPDVDLGVEEAEALDLAMRS